MLTDAELTLEAGAQRLGQAGKSHIKNNNHMVTYFFEFSIIWRESKRHYRQRPLNDDDMVPNKAISKMKRQ